MFGQQRHTFYGTIITVECRSDRTMIRHSHFFMMYAILNFIYGTHKLRK